MYFGSYGDSVEKPGSRAAHASGERLYGALHHLMVAPKAPWLPMVCLFFNSP